MSQWQKGPCASYMPAGAAPCEMCGHPFASHRTAASIAAYADLAAVAREALSDLVELSEHTDSPVITRLRAALERVDKAEREAT